LEFTRVRVQRAATDLCLRRTDSATACLQNSRRRLVNSFEEPLRHAPFEEKNRGAIRSATCKARIWSARILRAVRRHLACSYYPVATAPGTDPGSIKQRQRELKLIRDTARQTGSNR